MSHITRITAVGLVVGALASGAVQALPLVPPTSPPQRAEARDLLTLAADWLASLLSGSHGPSGHGTAGHVHSAFTGQEKEGTVLDPNGHH